MKDFREPSLRCLTMLVLLIACWALSTYSPVGKMAMQLVAAQMMSMVWSGPAGAQLMKTGAVRKARGVGQM